MDVDNNEADSNDADDQLQTNIDANILLTLHKLLRTHCTRCDSVGCRQNETDSNNADDQLQTTSMQTLLLTLHKLLLTLLPRA